MKKKIVIASVLKPVDDVRSYWKLSQSIAKTNKYEVNIIGNVGKKEKPEQNIKFHSYRISRKEWIKRWTLRGKILTKILQIQPSLLIITTHELIGIACIARLLTRCKIVYDVQENFSLNLTQISRGFIPAMIAWMVRLKEQFSRYFIHEFWLAEACYVEELSFTSWHHVIVENKATYYPVLARKMEPIRMIFSGTISVYGGVKNAFYLFDSLRKIEPKASIHIIGQIHDSSLHNWLIQQQKNQPEIELTLAENQIPHEEILEAISSANLGVIGYLPNNVNKNKIPTKLYEYSRYRIPYVVQKNTKWSEKGALLSGAIPIDFNDLKAEIILEKHKISHKFFKDPYPVSETWEYESEKVLASIERLI